MNELYWITRLDAISGVISVFAFVSWVATIILSIATVSTEKEDKEYPRYFKNSKIAFVCACIFTVIAVLTPTTNNALVIYGVGSTIDYVKSNDKAKKLPDKAIDALDRYLDNINNEKKINK